MSNRQLHHHNRLLRAHRVRSKLATHQELPRLTVFRSLRHISAQIIDDRTGRVLVSAYDTQVTPADKQKDKADKTAIAGMVGTAIAEKAKAAKVSAVRFDRGSYRYHGRVAALAEAARQGGLTF
jgi:large subunit ribosomal protein L18